MSAAFTSDLIIENMKKLSLSEYAQFQKSVAEYNLDDDKQLRLIDEYIYRRRQFIIRRLIVVFWAIVLLVEFSIFRFLKSMFPLPIDNLRLAALLLPVLFYGLYNIFKFYWSYKMCNEYKIGDKNNNMNRLVDILFPEITKPADDPKKD